MKIMQYFFVMIIISSCEREIAVELQNSDPVIVVNSFVNPDSFFVVNVSKSVGLLENDNVDFLEEAQVFIYEDDVLMEKLQHAYNGYFISNQSKPIQKRKYTFKVLNPGLTEATSTQIIPASVELSGPANKYFSVKEINNFKLKYCTIDFEFIDPDGENFYLFSLKNLTDSAEKRTYFTNENSYAEISFSGDRYKTINESSYINFSASDGGSEIVFSDKLIQGKKTKLSIVLRVSASTVSNDSIKSEIVSFDQTGNRYCAILHSISKDYYFYLKSLSVVNYTSFDDILREKTQMYTNINKGLGIFAGYSVSSKAFVLE